MYAYIYIYIAMIPLPSTSYMQYIHKDTHPTTVCRIIFGQFPIFQQFCSRLLVPKTVESRFATPKYFASDSPCTHIRSPYLRMHVCIRVDISEARVLIHLHTYGHIYTQVRAYILCLLRLRTWFDMHSFIEAYTRTYVHIHARIPGPSLSTRESFRFA